MEFLTWGTLGARDRICGECINHRIFMGVYAERSMLKSYDSAALMKGRFNSQDVILPHERAFGSQKMRVASVPRKSAADFVFISRY